MRQKKYLITGGCGFLGGALVHRLVKEGHFIRVLDNQSRGLIRRLDGIRNAIEFIPADIRDAEKVRKATQKMDSVIHLAFVNGTEYFYTQPETILDVGTKGMINILDACRTEGIQELVLASSSEVYQTPPRIPTDESVPLSIPDPFNPRYSYAAGKIISEIMAINYGRAFNRLIIVRPHNVYGPDMGREHVIPQFILRIRELTVNSPCSEITLPIQGSGDETRAFVYINDFIEGFMVVLNRGEHLNIYNIGTQEETPIKNLASEIGKYFNKKIKIIPGSLLPGCPLRRCPDITKLKKLGYHPRHRLKDGLQPVIRWYDRSP